MELKNGKVCWKRMSWGMEPKNVTKNWQSELVPPTLLLLTGITHLFTCTFGYLVFHQTAFKTHEIFLGVGGGGEYPQTSPRARDLRRSLISPHGVNTHLPHKILATEPDMLRERWTLIVFDAIQFS